MIHRIIFISLVLCSLWTWIECGNSRSYDPIVRVSNMTKPMEADAIRVCKQAFEKFHGYSKTSRSSIANFIRREFDRLHGSTWQCILGFDYALSITSENEKRIILDIGKVAILIFKGKC